MAATITPVADVDELQELKPGSLFAIGSADGPVYRLKRFYNDESGTTYLIASYVGRSGMLMRPVDALVKEQVFFLGTADDAD